MQVPPLPPAASQLSPSTPITGRDRRGFLAPWGSIPALIFVVVKSKYGWSKAIERASSPPFAISYLMGGIVGAVFIAAFMGWVVYRVCARSRTAGTIAFSVLLISLSAAAVVQSAKQGSEAASEQAASQQPVTTATTPFPLFGVAVDSPAGWI